MSADSNITVDIEAWIEKVITSIDNARQFKAANKLIKYYMVRLEQDGLGLYIRNHIDSKFDTLILRQRQILREKFNVEFNKSING